jgi:hypothetical protein
MCGRRRVGWRTVNVNARQFPGVVKTALVDRLISSQWRTGGPKPTKNGSTNMRIRLVRTGERDPGTVISTSCTEDITDQSRPTLIGVRCPWSGKDYIPQKADNIIRDTNTTTAI